MCGIAGQLHRQPRQDPNTRFLNESKQRLRSRGPDRQGEMGFPEVHLLHTRLSIQDLSMKGHQPMRLNDLGLTITYNGEIYNFKELRAELESLGHSFFSGTDTEVLLRGYFEWGKELLPRLNGMFAFAIFDETNKRLFLARDRLGIKPLYWRQGEQGFYFCSDLIPLLHTESQKPRLSMRALTHYMTFHSVVPAPYTLVENVFKLEPGHFIEIEGADQEVRPQPYWSLEFPSQDLSTRRVSASEEKDLLDELQSKLQQSIDRRLVADVPVGVFLSGGLDSSVITAMMAQSSSTPLQTFSIGFEGAKTEEGDEFRYSRQVAKRYQTEHHEISVNSQQLLEALPEALAAQSEPMVSHDNVGFYLLSKFASASTRVVQSGQGADEIFAGYHWYPPMSEAKNALEVYRMHFFDRDFQALKSISKESGLEDWPSLFVEDFFSRHPSASPLNKALAIDQQVMLIEDPVKRVDNNTMAFGLEARVPFLDHELVEFSAMLPESLKLKNGGKGLLKELGYRWLPKEVIDRPKGYFPVPELKYLSGPFLAFAKAILSHPLSRSEALFKKDYVSQLLVHPENHLTPLRGSQLWQITVLDHWLTSHDVEVA